MGTTGISIPEMVVIGEGYTGAVHSITYLERFGFALNHGEGYLERRASTYKLRDVTLPDGWTTYDIGNDYSEIDDENGITRVRIENVGSMASRKTRIIDPRFVREIETVQGIEGHLLEKLGELDRELVRLGYGSLGLEKSFDQSIRRRLSDELFARIKRCLGMTNDSDAERTIEIYKNNGQLPESTKTKISEEERRFYDSAKKDGIDLLTGICVGGSKAVEDVIVSAEVCLYTRGKEKAICRLRDGCFSVHERELRNAKVGVYGKLDARDCQFEKMRGVKEMFERVFEGQLQRSWWT